MSSPRHFCVYSYRHFLHTYPPLNWMFVVPFLPTCWSIASDFLSAACHGKKKSTSGFLPTWFVFSKIYSTRLIICTPRAAAVCNLIKKNYRPPSTYPFHPDWYRSPQHICNCIFPPLHSLFIYINLIVIVHVYL